MAIEDLLKTHERVLYQLLDDRVAAAGRAKADAFVIRTLIDALAVSGLLERGPFDQSLGEALQAARAVPTGDATQAALWVAFANRVAEIMGSAAPDKPKGS